MGRRRRGPVASCSAPRSSSPPPSSWPPARAYAVPFSSLPSPLRKKVVWVLQDWSVLGPATAVQVLDDPGIPEEPGQSEH